MKSYHGDKDFTDELERCNRTIDLSGVGAHHQNYRLAENSIRVVTEKARAMMQHAYSNWPEEFDVAFWPFAADSSDASWHHSHTPDQSPEADALLEIFWD